MRKTSTGPLHAVAVVTETVAHGSTEGRVVAAQEVDPWHARDAALARIAGLEQELYALRKRLQETEKALDLATTQCAQVAARNTEVLRQQSDLVEEKRLADQALRTVRAQTDDTIAVLSAKLAAAQTPAHRATQRWTVRQAADDRNLEVLLNLLSDAGWTIERVVEPRGGVYRVFAWTREEAVPHG